MAEVRILAASLLGAIAALGAVAVSARAMEHDGHAKFHDAYREWKIPFSVRSCCNAKYSPEGEMVGGDCYPTDAFIKEGRWWAIRDDGVPVLIPEDRIVKYPNPDPAGRAHLCFLDGEVRCFRTPIPGT